MDNLTASKTCTKCEVEKPVSEFNKQAKSKDGYHYYCRECQRATRPNYDANKFEFRAAPQVGRDRAGWRADNKEHIRAYKAAYRAANRDKIKAYEDLYYGKNAERLRAEGAERAKNWREGNPDKARLKNDRRRAMKLEAFVEDVDLAVVLEVHGAVCVVCASEIDLDLRHPHPLSVSLEHVVPLARGGEHSYKNCAPSHLRCNISKGVKPLGDFAS